MMTILLVGVCQNGMVRHNGWGINGSGVKQWGITDPTPCKKCGGKGCARPTTDAAEADADAS